MELRQPEGPLARLLPTIPQLGNLTVVKQMLLQHLVVAKRASLRHLLAASRMPLLSLRHPSAASQNPVLSLLVIKPTIAHAAPGTQAGTNPVVARPTGGVLMVHRAAGPGLMVAGGVVGSVS